MFSAVNAVDASGLESLEAINHRLGDVEVCLHLSEVKGPAIDRLRRSELLDDLHGQVFLSQNRAIAKLLENGEGALDKARWTGPITGMRAG